MIITHHDEPVVRNHETKLYNDYVQTIESSEHLFRALQYNAVGNMRQMGRESEWK